MPAGLALLGGRDANPWAWNGESRELHDQVIQDLLSVNYQLEELEAEAELPERADELARLGLEQTRAGVSG